MTADTRKGDAPVSPMPEVPNRPRRQMKKPANTSGIAWRLSLVGSPSGGSYLPAGGRGSLKKGSASRLSETATAHA